MKAAVGSMVIVACVFGVAGWLRHSCSASAGSREAMVAFDALRVRAVVRAVALGCGRGEAAYG